MSRPRARPETGRAQQPRRREVDGEAEAVAGAGDAKRRALPASGSPWTREGRGRRSRTGPRRSRAGGARARRLFRYGRDGEPPSHLPSAPTTWTTEGGGDGARGTIEVVQGGGFSRRPGRASERRRNTRRQPSVSRSGVPRAPSPPPVPHVLSYTRQPLGRPDDPGDRRARARARARARTGTTRPKSVRGRCEPTSSAPRDGTRPAASSSRSRRRGGGCRGGGRREAARAPRIGITMDPRRPRTASAERGREDHGQEEPGLVVSSAMDETASPQATYSPRRSRGPRRGEGTGPAGP